jgi:aminopeptidase N
MQSPRPSSQRTTVAALALLACLSPARAAEPPLDASTRDFDQVHLTLRVEPRISEGVIEGEATLRFLSMADAFRLLRLHSAESTVLEVRDGSGRILQHETVDDILRVHLAEPVARGVEATVRIRYRSRPTAGLYFHHPTAEAPSTPVLLYSQGQSDDNRRWFPIYDSPDDRFTVELFATVPADLQTVSIGTLAASTAREGGRREDHWRIEQRIPSYLISLIVGKYEKVTEMHGTVPLEYLGPPGRAEEVRRGCGATPAMMRFFEAYLATPYPYPRYAQTTVWDFVYGGMENASATTMNMRLLHHEAATPNYSPDGLVAHELAHQWFGDLITCRTWDHLWLNEGFATYFTDLFFEHRDGPEEFALRRRRQNHDYMGGTLRPDTLGLRASPRGDLPLELHGGKQYDRGAAILHQLRIELGDDVFRDGMRHYVARRADSAVDSEDLRRSMEDVAKRDLSWFFKQWVYGAGYPVLKFSWKFAGPDAAMAIVTVEQTQNGGGGQPDAFRISVPVRFGAGPNSVRRVLDVRRRKQEFEISVPDAATRTYLRAGDGGAVLARIEVEQSRAAWTALLASDPDATGRMDAVTALGEWPDAALPALAAAAKTDSCHAVREDAVRALGAIGGPAAKDALLAAGADGDRRVREAVARALGEFSAAETGAALAALSTGDDSDYVRAAAARSLGRVRADGAFDLLISLLDIDSHRETLRAGALDGLTALGDRRALERARPLLAYEWPRGDHHSMRESAMGLLLALDTDSVDTRDALVRLLRDPYHRTRIQAARWCADYAVRDAIPRLRMLAEKDGFDSVREAAKAALRALDAQGAKR